MERPYFLASIHLFTVYICYHIRTVNLSFNVFPSCQMIKAYVIALRHVCSV